MHSRSDQRRMKRGERPARHPHPTAFRLAGTFALGAAITLSAWAWDPEHPDDPAAQSAAVQALGHNSEQRGRTISGEVRTFSGEVRSLQGVRTDHSGAGSTLTARIDALNQAIADLGADVRTQDILVDLSGDVLFDFDKADLRPEAEEKLAAAALIIREKRRGTVIVEGHTDAKGNEAYNQDLSERRAHSVKQWLMDHGIPGEVIKTHGYGETRPVAPNVYPDGRDNPQGRAKNRRVVLIVQTAQSAPAP